MEPCFLNSMAMMSALGSHPDDIKQRLLHGNPVLDLSQDYHSGPPLPIGRIQETLPEIPLDDAKYQSRNNQLAWAVAQKIMPDIKAAINQYGKHRIGVIIGTSTSGISDSEVYLREHAESGEMPAGFDYRMQEMGATARFLAVALGTCGPTFSISTACSSGAKALASARRLIRSGICDAVIAGGVDTLCQLTVQGFASLEAVSEQQCNPFSENRNGINIGEAGALFLVSKEKSAIELAGVGESSDAHHISAPDPSGAGAIRCMLACLKDANIDSQAINYLNLHGTATQLNDQMESKAVSEVFGANTPCSSTKPFTGHTLGAAGALEAAICWLSLTESFIPKHLWDGCQDPNLPNIGLSEGAQHSSISYALSNSFAFGGNNISLILRKTS
ncbi:beta-ketoacyl-[acyl-carrier-protein] synthase family protein [Marinomonas sp. C1424]|uniref:Beta-ketoacyl-[acyl-carrier-protein] synthase family protein n=2 Tax=Marinomonas transparens TaxID=2795388 RepID=A0A934JQ90_9GAMM|nr:beta-ketoacyl-[acyl-carrier-protein] synthase family protein [Marinomonas transparens]